MHLRKYFKEKIIETLSVLVDDGLIKGIHQGKNYAFSPEHLPAIDLTTDSELIQNEIIITDSVITVQGRELYLNLNIIANSSTQDHEYIVDFIGNAVESNMVNISSIIINKMRVYIHLVEYSAKREDNFYIGTYKIKISYKINNNNMSLKNG